MFYVRLKNAQSKLSKSEYKIATYISENLKKAKDMTSYDLADKTEVSQPTVIRFANKLGYKSFSEMCEDISSSVDLEIDSTMVSPNESTQESIVKLSQNYTSMLKEVINYNDSKLIDKVVKKIIDAKMIFCSGAQSSNSIAELLTNRLLELGLFAYNTTDSFLGFSYIEKMKQNDVAIFISASGESAMTLRLAKLAKEKNVTIIAITGTQNNSLKELADYCLCCSESIIYTNISSLTNRFSQLFLIDCIYLGLWKMDTKRFNKHITEIDGFTRPDFGGFQFKNDKEL